MEDGDKHFCSLLRLFSPKVNRDEDSKAISLDENNVSATVPGSDGRPPGTFLYDGFAKIDATPKAIYKANVMSLVSNVLQGYNGALVSLGLESTDHFSFVLGPQNSILHESAGYILRCIKKLRKNRTSSNLTVPCSYVLIANEKVHDLLQDFDHQGSTLTTQSSSNDVENPHHSISVSDSRVKGCKTVEAKQLKDIASMLRHGSKAMNGILLGMPGCGVHHCAFTIGIEYSKFGSMFAPISGTFTAAVLILPDNVDINALGGQQAAVDTQSIAVLQSVVDQQLSVACSSHQPEEGSIVNRSVLTRLLEAAFGGNCKTLLMTHMANTVPVQQLTQSCSLLDFASRARNIHNRPDKTELAEKALMDAYYKEMRRQICEDDAKIEVEELVNDSKDEEDEVMIAQALASAVKDGFEDEDSEEEEESEERHFARQKRISLKPKNKAKRKSKHVSSSSSTPVPKDITVESLVGLIQDPDNGVPRASGRALVNVQIHRGKGSVFSGASIVEWLLRNINGVETVEDAEQLGQILLDKGAIFHSDGSSLFFNAENLFYYARDPLSTGKSLSIEEIKALLAPAKREAELQPTLQVTTIQNTQDEKEQQSHEESTAMLLDRGNESVEKIEGMEKTDLKGTAGTETHSLDNTTEESKHEPVVHFETATQQISKHASAPQIQSTSECRSQDESTCSVGNGETCKDNEGTEDTLSHSQAQSVEKADQPNVRDLQDVDLVTLERSADYPHPLHFASATGKESGVIEQLVKWYGVDCLDQRSRTPLMFAALGNKAAVCRVLIDCGAVVNKRDKSGLTAAHVACYHGSKDALSVLLSKGANTANLDRMFHSVYHWSMVPANPACMKILLRHFSKKPVLIHDMVDKHGLTPLHWAIFYNHSEHLSLLIKRSLNLLKLDAKGRTLMTYAIRKNSIQCVQVLATSESGVDLASAPDKGGLTPLHHASVEKSPFYVAYIFDTLKETNASCIEAKDSEGRTPLHYAAVYGRHQNVQLLLQFGADSGAKDNQGKTPLELAQRYHGEVNDSLARLLQDGPESEIDLNLILTPTKSQHVNSTQSKVCIIL